MKLSEFADNLNVSIVRHDGAFYAADLTGQYIPAGEEVNCGSTVDDIIDNLPGELIDKFFDNAATPGSSLFKAVVNTNKNTPEEVFERNRGKYGPDDIVVLMLGALLNPMRFIVDDISKDNEE